MTRHRRRILRVLLDAKEPLSVADLVQQTQMNSDTVRRSLHGLERIGWVLGRPLKPYPRIRRIYAIAPLARTYVRDIVLDDKS